MARRKKPDKFRMDMHKATGQYVKEHKGMPYYFGADRDEALRRYVDEWPRILKGENRYGVAEPAKPQQAQSLTVRELVNRFLSAKRQQVD
jgi:hypothetical protein